MHTVLMPFQGALGPVHRLFMDFVHVLEHIASLEFYVVTWSNVSNLFVQAFFAIDAELPDVEEAKVKSELLFFDQWIQLLGQELSREKEGNDEVALVG